MKHTHTQIASGKLVQNVQSMQAFIRMSPVSVYVLLLFPSNESALCSLDILLSVYLSLSYYVIRFFSSPCQKPYQHESPTQKEIERGERESENDSKNQNTKIIIKTRTNQRTKNR